MDDTSQIGGGGQLQSDRSSTEFVRRSGHEYDEEVDDDVILSQFEENEDDEEIFDEFKLPSENE